MAKKMTNKFNLNESTAIEENERILEQGEAPHAPQPAAPVQQSAQQSTQQPVQQPMQQTAQQPVQQPAPSAYAPMGYPPAAPYLSPRPRGAKRENGISISVPMEYYERITILKMRTGIPIRDLALRAVIEFLDNHADGQGL